MIKLTQLLFTVKDEALDRQNAIDELYEEVCNEAEMLGKSLPLPPQPLKYEDEDYDKLEVILYLDPTIITDITQNYNLDTQVTCSNLRAVLVKETPEEVYNLKNEYDERHNSRKI